jgi:hypothetical protein
MAENVTASSILECNSGGFLNVCYGKGESGFIGCCDADACGSVGCDNGSLRNTSFDAAFHYKVPDQSCPETGTIFYTCEALNPTFWGCCKIDPCKAGGCPPGDLVGAQIKSLPGNPFIPATALSTADASGTTVAPESSATNTDGGSGGKSSVPLGAIIGAAVGGAAVLAFIVFLIFFCLRRRKNKAKKAEAAAATANTNPDPADPNAYHADNKVMSTRKLSLLPKGTSLETY